MGRGEYNLTLTIIIRNNNGGKCPQQIGFSLFKTVTVRFAKKSSLLHSTKRRYET